MLQVLRWTAWTAIILALSGCTSFHDYIHNGFKVGPNYARPPLRWPSTGSTPAMCASNPIGGFVSVVAGF